MEILGATVRISSKDFRPVKGPSMLGEGVTPHEVIELTMDDVRNEEYATYEAARSWLQQKIAATASLPSSGV